VTASRTAAGASLGLAALGLAGGLRAQAKPADPYGPQTAAAYSASASAALLAPRAALVDGRRPWVPEKAKAPPIPADASPRPAKTDWKDAPVAVEARVTEPNCTVRRLREWYQLRCQHIGIQLVAGTREEVEFGEHRYQVDQSPDEVWVTFPARRNTTRYFQIYARGKWSPNPDAQASFQWLDGDDFPLITVQGLRWGI